MNIHCIGDSHSAFFSGEDHMQPVYPEQASNLLNPFKNYRIGPATAYNLHTKKEIIESIFENHVGNEDKVMFCFGEVDCRAHIIKQAEIQNKSWLEITAEIVERYIQSIIYYKKYDVELIAWGPIASWSIEKAYTGPSHGTNEERNKVTEIFNGLLKIRCLQEGIKFFTIFDKMINEDNTTKTYYLDNWKDSHMHLAQTAIPLMLKELKNELN